MAVILQNLVKTVSNFPSQPNIHELVLLLSFLDGQQVFIYFCREIGDGRFCKSHKGEEAAVEYKLLVVALHQEKVRWTGTPDLQFTIFEPYNVA